MADTPLPSTLTLPCVEESCQFAADDVEGFTAPLPRGKRRAPPPTRKPSAPPTHDLPLAPSQHGFVVVRDVLSAAELAATRGEMWRSPSLLDADAPAHAAGPARARRSAPTRARGRAGTTPSAPTAAPAAARAAGARAVRRSARRPGGRRARGLRALAQPFRARGAPWAGRAENCRPASPRCSAPARCGSRSTRSGLAADARAPAAGPGRTRPRPRARGWRAAMAGWLHWRVCLRARASRAHAAARALAFLSRSLGISCCSRAQGPGPVGAARVRGRGLRRAHAAHGDERRLRDRAGAHREFE